MAKPWDRKPLWELIYMSDDKVHLRAAVIIGYAGCSPTEFFDAAKKMPDYDVTKYRRAMENLTVFIKREPPTLRCDLHDEARRAARILLGPAPAAPDYCSWWRSRLISVRQMKEAGQPVEWAESPPVPLPEDKPAEEPPKEKPTKPARKARPRTKAAKE